MSSNLTFISAEASTGGGSPGGAWLLIVLAVWVILIIGLWKVFVKSGQPGWACLIPIYNLYCVIKIARKEWWWLLLFLVPLVNIIAAIALAIAISRGFRKGGGFAAGLILLPWIFFPILGFGAAEYQRSSQPASA